VVADAARSYRPSAFDTVSWASDSVRVQKGNEVYASTCRRCHGAMGRGDTDVAEARDLEVPSLVEPDWQYAASLDSVRKRIYTGHPEGMPTFGTFRLTPREIDGAAWYIVEQLRPEVLSGAG
jgi:mono/diheme cytochrome c family protein